MSKSARARGNEAEDLACTYLEQKGWEILQRNYYAGKAEVDIIGRDGEVIVFVEVKMRSSTQFGSPVEFVKEDKVMRIYSAAQQWVIENDMMNAPLRFDVIGIKQLKNKEPEIDHLIDAYR